MANVLPAGHQRSVQVAVLMTPAEAKKVKAAYAAYAAYAEYAAGGSPPPRFSEYKRKALMAGIELLASNAEGDEPATDGEEV